MSAGYELLLVRGAGASSEALTRWLRGYGHEVTCAGSPVELREALEERVPEALLVDPRSWGPGMREILASLDAAALSCPVILLGGVELEDLTEFRAWAARTPLRVIGGLHAPFSPAELEEVLGRSVLCETEFTEADVLDGAAAGELEAIFLPRVAASGLEVIGHEARLIWEHPETGRMTAGQLLPRVSSGRAARALTRWLVEHALECRGEWLREDTRRELIIPIGAADLIEEQLPGRLSRLMVEAGLYPSQLLLEVGDLRPLIDPLEAAPWLERLSREGIRISVGDHGGEGWGETLVARGCVHELRLDRRLVARSRGDSDARVMSWLAVRAASLMEVRVVAQGVDDAGTFELMRTMGVEQVQGAFAGRAEGPVGSVRATGVEESGREDTGESPDERCA